MIGSAIDDANSPTDQLITQLISQINNPNSSISELTNQLISKLIDVLTTVNATNDNNGKTGTQNSTAVENGNDVLDDKQITELIKELTHLLDKPITTTDDEYMDELITKLMNELASDNVEDTDSAVNDTGSTAKDTTSIDANNKSTITSGESFS